MRSARRAGKCFTGIVMPAVRGSLFGAVFLGLGRALGETMAVTFVIGNANRLPDSFYAPTASIASIVANAFPEAEQGSLNLGRLVRARLHLVRRVFHRAGARAAAAASGAHGMSIAARQPSQLLRRRWGDALMSAVCVVAALIGLTLLALILWTLIEKGMAGLSIDLFTQTMTTPGQNGGLRTQLSAR